MNHWPLRPDGEPEEAAVAEVSRDRVVDQYLVGSDIPFYVESASYPLINWWRLCVPVSRLEDAKELIREIKKGDSPVVFLEDIEEIWEQFPPAE